MTLSPCNKTGNPYNNFWGVSLAPLFFLLCTFLVKLTYLGQGVTVAPLPWSVVPCCPVLCVCPHTVAVVALLQEGTYQSKGYSVYMSSYSFPVGCIGDNIQG